MGWKGNAMPIDSSPRGAEVLHQPPQPKYPEPRPGQESDEPVRGQLGAAQAERDGGMAGRPSLPDRPEPMAVDVEDEEADPVIDSGPGIDDDGLKSLRKQRG
jgi:hypothetical protein